MAGRVGASGRPRKPTALKIVDGNPGRYPLPKDEPKPPEVAEDGAKPPAWLPPFAKREYKRLYALLRNMRVLTVADLGALEAIALAADQMRETTKTIRKLGMTFTAKNAAGDLTYRLRPEVQARSDAWRRYMTGLIEFGLTPASRTRVKVIGGIEKPAEQTRKANPAAEFFG
jgi:P27 family predicted phage terminase small subunit